MMLGDSDMMLVVTSVIVADGDSKKLSVFVFVTGVGCQPSFRYSVPHLYRALTCDRRRLGDHACCKVSHCDRRAFCNVVRR